MSALTYAEQGDLIVCILWTEILSPFFPVSHPLLLHIRTDQIQITEAPRKTEKDFSEYKTVFSPDLGVCVCSSSFWSCVCSDQAPSEGPRGDRGWLEGGRMPWLGVSLQHSESARASLPLLPPADRPLTRIRKAVEDQASPFYCHSPSPLWRPFEPPVRRASLLACLRLFCSTSAISWASCSPKGRCIPQAGQA